MRSADDELEDRPEDHYDDAISPPLFLLIAPLLLQALSTAFPSVAISADPGLPYAAAIVLGAVLWYGAAEIRWFRRDMDIGGVRATGLSLIAFVIASLAAPAIAIGVALQLPGWTAPD